MTESPPSTKEMAARHEAEDEKRHVHIDFTSFHRKLEELTSLQYTKPRTTAASSQIFPEQSTDELLFLMDNFAFPGERK